jgi:hypothetical protein
VDGKNAHPYTQHHGNLVSSLSRTLQELIAPRYLEFYDMNWRPCGSRSVNTYVLEEVMGINSEILDRNPEQDLNLSRWSIATRMSWASKRETTRKEDIAYCLFGIFNVHLAPLYGEGPRRAFERLQQEIIKATTDLSFLAWVPQLDDKHYWKSRKISGMATRPGDFEGGSQIINNRVSRLEAFHTTNKGLCLNLPLVRETPSSNPSYAGTRYIAILTDCYKSKDGNPETLVGIQICLSDPKDNFYYRRCVADSSLCSVTDSMLEQARTETFYLATRDIPDTRWEWSAGWYN